LAATIPHQIIPRPTVRVIRANPAAAMVVAAMAVAEVTYANAAMTGLS
jgi:hypothetical protein